MAIIFIFSRLNLKYFKNLKNKGFYHEVLTLSPSKIQCQKVLISTHPNDPVYQLSLDSNIFLSIFSLFIPALLLNLLVQINRMPKLQFMSLSLCIENTTHFLLLKPVKHFPQFLLISQDLPTRMSMLLMDFNPADCFSYFNNLYTIQIHFNQILSIKQIFLRA